MREVKGTMITVACGMEQVRSNVSLNKRLRKGPLAHEDAGVENGPRRSDDELNE